MNEFRIFGTSMISARLFLYEGFTSNNNIIIIHSSSLITFPSFYIQIPGYMWMG